MSTDFPDDFMNDVRIKQVIEPSRLQIAAMCLQGLCADPLQSDPKAMVKFALMVTDELIRQANE